MSKSAHYPDLPPDTLGELKKIERLPGMKRKAPKIRWGLEYMSWPVEKRLTYSENLTASMNHAADVLQGERNALIGVCKRQEQQLEQSQAQYVAQGETMHRELAAQDAEKQQLYQEIVKLKQEAKRRAKKIKELESEIFELKQGHEAGASNGN